MSGEFRAFGQELRKLIEDGVRRHAPGIERYHVKSLKPLTLESFSSDDKLVDGEDGFDVTRNIRVHAKVGHTVVVSTDAEGDKIAHGLIIPKADEEEEEAKEKEEAEKGGGG